MAASIIYCRACGTQNVRGESFCASCGAALTSSGMAVTSLPASTPTGQLAIQTLLKQRYRVLQNVGNGGMGAIYLAQDTQLGDRRVAVKEMSQSGLFGQQAQQAVENFKHEAHMLANLQHPNLPSIYDHFEEDGRWYLVMSFIQGESLEDYLAQMSEHKLPLEEALQIGMALCDVLNYLHSQQPPIIFRDLKPSNIMRTPDGRIYLIDFGIARLFKPGQSKDTATYGSMGYAPPEQYGRAQTTERSDIYSLGVTLYELLSGYNPSSSPFRLPPLQTLVPTLPVALTSLIAEMIEMDENQRPTSIKVVQQRLQQVTPQLVTPPPPLNQYAYTPVTPIPPTPYAPPPPPLLVQHEPGPQVFLPVYPVHQPASNQRASSVGRAFLKIVGTICSIIGIIAGILSILLGIFALFVPEGNFVTNLWLAGLFIFLGLMLIFIALIRKTRFPLTPARKRKAALGKFLGIVGVISGIILLILGIIYINTNSAGAILIGPVVCGEAVVIWLVTRIKIKKTRNVMS